MSSPLNRNIELCHPASRLNDLLSMYGCFLDWCILTNVKILSILTLAYLFLSTTIYDDVRKLKVWNSMNTSSMTKCWAYPELTLDNGHLVFESVTLWRFVYVLNIKVLLQTLWYSQKTNKHRSVGFDDGLSKHRRKLH